MQEEFVELDNPLVTQAAADISVDISSRSLIVPSNLVNKTKPRFAEYACSYTEVRALGRHRCFF